MYEGQRNYCMYLQVLDIVKQQINYLDSHNPGDKGMAVVSYIQYGNRIYQIYVDTLVKFRFLRTSLFKQAILIVGCSFVCMLSTKHWIFDPYNFTQADMP
jgi:hypothetical protein